MTIRFVQQWNGYSPDTIVTLAGAEETRLIGLGYAVTDLDGPGNTPLRVTSTTNLTGLVEFSDGDTTLPISPFISTLATSSILPKWKKALANVIAGVADARIVFTGDSITAGAGAVGGRRQNAFPALLGNLLNDMGIPVNKNISFCDGTNLGGATFTTFDNRWTTVGTAWATLGTFATFGGRALFNDTTTQTLSFAPGALAENQFDSFDVYYMANTGYGTFTINVDGGAPIATPNANEARQIRKVTCACALGTHTINIARTGVGAGVYIVGIVCRNTTGPKKVEIYNGGLGSARIAQLADNLVSPRDYQLNNVVAFLAPHLTITDITANDRANSLYSSFGPTWDADFQEIATNYLTSGDWLPCVSMPSALSYVPAYTTQENQEAYDAAVIRIAAANNCVVYNKRTRIPTFEADSSYYNADKIHQSLQTNGVIALDLLKILTM